MEQENKEKIYKRFGKTEKRLLVSCVCLVLAGGLMMLAETAEGFAEWYAENVYPLLVFLIGHLMGAVPFSLAEIGVYALVLSVIITAIRAGIRGKRERNYGREALRWASGLFLTATVLFLLYVMNCGINYRRVSFSEEEGLITKEYSTEELREVCEWLTEELNLRADKVERDQDGVMILEEQSEKRAVQAMKSLSEQYDSLEGYYPQPKKLAVSETLSYQSLTGIYSPFTVEANYNGDMMPYNIPFTACHELSHLRGFMQEEEANFIAFLACESAKETEFQYSGYLLAWIYSMNTLYRVDSEQWSEVRDGLDEPVEADLQANNRFWDFYEGAVSELADKVNDTYLKVNGQADGVKSYNRMVDLLVVYYQNK